MSFVTLDMDLMIVLGFLSMGWWIWIVRGKRLVVCW